jgi:fructose-1,6-bisphosphatase/inositol monophosphatase family enzyme
VDQSAHLLELALELAAGASALMLERLDQPRSDVRTKSTGTDMVTEVDKASESLIVDGIRRARPGDGILSEEGAGGEGSSGYRWVIDPVDGTTNYLYGHPGFGVSIAVEREGEVVVGLVEDPMHRETFTAIRGRGAFRNGDPISVSTETELGSALVATGFGYAPERRVAQAEVLTKVIGRIRDVRRMGAAAVDLCSVACGRVDAYFERGLNHWDLAAGALIASEAGARLGAIDGGPPLPGSVVAAPPDLFEPLQELLVAAGAGEHV